MWIAANCILIHRTRPVIKGRRIRQSVTSSWLKCLRHGLWYCCNWYDISLGMVTQFLKVCFIHHSHKCTHSTIFLVNSGKGSATAAVIFGRMNKVIRVKGIPWVYCTGGL